MKYRFESMGDPLFMAHMQAGIDAWLHRSAGVEFNDALTMTIERVRYLFGEDIPARLIHDAVRRAYRRSIREGVMK